MTRRIVRQIDLPSTLANAGIVTGDETPNILPPAPPSVPEPLGLALTTELSRSAQTPSARIIATWSAPYGTAPQSYTVRWSLSNTFPDGSTWSAEAREVSAVIEGLRCNTTYYVQVSAYFRGRTSPWTDPVGILTLADSTPPPAPTNGSYVFDAGGNLVIGWTPPVSETFKTVELRIFSDAARTVEYARLERGGNQFVWSAAENRRVATLIGGGPDPVVFVELRSLSWSNVYSSTVLSGTATKSRPDTPGSASADWDAVAGTCSFGWAPVADAVAYKLTIDGVARFITDTRFAYTVAQNRLDHGGTPNPSLVWSLVAVDALDQTSQTPAGGTKTLPRPATPANPATTWSGKTGTCGFRWDAVAKIVGYRLTIDGKARDLTLTSYSYDLAVNKLEHANIPDPSLDWSLVSVDGLGQTSQTPASGTATLPRPTAPPVAAGAWQAKVGTCGFSWVGVLDVLGYILTIDGKARSLLDPTTAYDYVVAQNRAEHGGTADPILTWSVVSYDALGQTSQFPIGGNAELPLPNAPTPLSWVFTGIDAVWTYNDAADIVNHYVMTIDGVARVLQPQQTTGGTSTYTYPFALNKKEHANVPDPSLAYSLIAVDGIDQQSPAVSGTATNYAPVAPTSIALVAGPSQIAFTINGIRPTDFDHYHYRVLRDGAAVDAADMTTAAHQYIAAAGLSTYQIGATITDVFGQPSSETLSPTVDLDPLTLEALRANAQYHDDYGRTTALDVLRTSGTAYYDGGYVFHWTEMQRPQRDRYKYISVASGAPIESYYGVSADGVTYEWFAGPLAADGTTLTSYGSGEPTSAAATNAFTHRLVGLPVRGRVALPTIPDGRFIRVIHAHSVAYDLYTFYARRYLQLDDFEAELIKGMDIVGEQFAATKLSSIAALLGEVTVSGVVDIGAQGGIWQGTAGNFANPVTGFKLWNDNGVGRLATYKDGAEQVGFDGNGALRFGGGAGAADASGLRFLSDTAAGAQGQKHITWLAPNGTTTANVFGVAGTNGTFGGLTLESTPQGTATSSQATTLLRSRADDNNYASVELTSLVNTATGSSIVLSILGRTGSNASVGAGLSLYTTGVEVSGPGFKVLNGASAVFGVNAAASSVSVTGTLGVSGATTFSGAATFASSVAFNSAITTAVTASSGAFTGSATPYVPATATGSNYQYAVEIGHTGGTGAGFIQTSRRLTGGFFDYGTRNLGIIAGGALTFATGGGTTRMAIDASGNISIGGAALNLTRLAIKGQQAGSSVTSTAIAAVDSANTTLFYVNDAGAGYLKANAWSYGSDRRLKSRVLDLTATNTKNNPGRGLREILALRPRRFDYKSGADNNLGFVAQELREIIPELVNEQADGMLSVQTTALIPVLVNAVKELHADRVELTATVQELHADRSVLMATVQDLLARVAALESVR